MPRRRKAFEDRVYRHQAPRRGQNPHRQFPFPFELNRSLHERNDETGMTRNQQKSWLRRSATWRDLDPNVWQPRKVLGAGSYGVCGLWRRKTVGGLAPNDIVVKQNEPGTAYSLKWESYLLGEIMHASGGGTEHVVKLYKAVHMAGGTGASETLDPLPFKIPHTRHNYDVNRQVARMYIEYCPGGDANTFLEMRQEYHRRNEPFPEEYIWRWLYCMAKALGVLDRGLETGNRPQGTFWDGHRAIIHFDIKWDNVLQGLKDGVHRKYPIFKLADFGLALPRMKNLDHWPGGRGEWEKDTAWRSPIVLIPPENYFRRADEDQHPQRDEGDEKINMWQLGCMLQELITGRRVSIRRSFDVPIQPAHQGGPSTYRTFARYRSNRYDAFSVPLIDLLFKLLAYDPSMRPDSSYLEARVRQHLMSYDQLDAGSPPEQEHGMNSTPPNVALFNTQRDYWENQAPYCWEYTYQSRRRDFKHIGADHTRNAAELLLHNAGPSPPPLPPPNPIPPRPGPPPTSPLATRNAADTAARQARHAIAMNNYNAAVNAHTTAVNANSVNSIMANLHNLGGLANAGNAWPPPTSDTWPYKRYVR